MQTSMQTHPPRFVRINPNDKFIGANNFSKLWHSFAKSKSLVVINEQFCTTSPNCSVLFLSLSLSLSLSRSLSTSDVGVCFVLKYIFRTEQNPGWNNWINHKNSYCFIPHINMFGEDWKEILFPNINILGKINHFEWINIFKIDSFLLNSMNINYWIVFPGKMGMD